MRRRTVVLAVAASLALSGVQAMARGPFMLSSAELVSETVSVVDAGSSASAIGSSKSPSASGLCAMENAGTSASGTFKEVEDKQAVMEKLSGHTATLTSIEATFKQTKYLSVFSSSVVSDGIFYYSKPDKICMDYTGSPKYRITINGEKMKTVSGGKSSVMSLSGNPMMGQMGTLIPACMTGDISSLSSGYKVGVKESDSQWLIEVVPVSQTVRDYLQAIDIYFDKATLSLVMIVMKESSTDYTEYVFTRQKFNSSIDEKIFSVR